MEESYFDKIEKDIKKEHTFFVDFGLDFAKQVRYVLSIHPTIKTQRDLAKAMGKKESEVSKMLTGLHNLTLESISKMSGVLDYDLILTDLKAQQKYNSHLVSTNVMEGEQTIHMNITITTINLYIEQLPKLEQSYLYNNELTFNPIQLSNRSSLKLPMQ